ncbi:MAG: hypothetical protein HZA53_19255 [Planctomycetes bacterium]|nr:hypothetical protein [Planctomycetota bacterium]
MGWCDLLEACGEGLELLLWAAERRWRLACVAVLVAATILLAVFSAG